MLRIFRLPALTFSLALAGLTFPGPVHAVEEHADDFLTHDSNLSLTNLLEITLERHPRSSVVAAGQNTARAEADYGKTWFPEAPELAGFHLSDNAFDDIGAYENEVALSVPLWLPGEKTAQTALGEAAWIAYESHRNDLRWRVSAALRRQLWDLATAKRRWELALEQEQRMADVLEQVTLFTEAGDLSRADQLATLQELAIWKAETMTLEAQYQDAVREYRSLTGLGRSPAEISEQLSEEQEIREDHPALQLAMDRLKEASAMAEVTRQGNVLRPSVQVFWRGFRGDRTGPDIDALGFGLAVPLGKSPRQGPQIARADEVFAGAQAEVIETRRRLDLQLHEARHQLKTTRLQLANSDVMIDAANERHRMDKLAFELGEIPLHEWLRRLARQKAIERAHEMLLLQQGAAIASYNQAVGETL